MTSFRFEYHENVITKHHLGKKLHWSQAARWAFDHANDDKSVHIVSMKQIDADTFQIVKRRDQNLGFFYRTLGTTQQGLYERVTVNRKTQEVAVDRLDGNWWHDEPFVGRRDTFYVENREGSHSSNGSLTMVRHDFWLPFYSKFWAQFQSNFSAWSYKSAFASQAAN